MNMFIVLYPVDESSRNLLYLTGIILSLQIRNAGKKDRDRGSPPRISLFKNATRDYIMNTNPLVRHDTACLKDT